jgi:hypothetical protein
LKFPNETFISLISPMSDIPPTSSSFIWCSVTKQQTLITLLHVIYGINSSSWVTVADW